MIYDFYTTCTEVVELFFMYYEIKLPCRSNTVTIMLKGCWRRILYDAAFGIKTSHVYVTHVTVMSFQCNAQEAENCCFELQSSQT